MSSTFQLPQSVQQVVDSSDPRFQGANAAPQIPGTSLPPAPPQAVPAAPQIQQPQDRVADLANMFLANLISKDKAAQPQPPQNPTQNGSFASKLQSAVSGVSA